MPAKIKVLVVDDEKEFADEISNILKEEGAEVLTLYGGEGAAELVRKKEIDLVFLDIRMPGKDGLTTIEEIKQARPETEIYFLTAFQETHLGLAAAERGASHFLAKPIRPRELAKAFQNAAIYLETSAALARQIEEHNQDYQYYQDCLSKLEQLYQEKCRTRKILIPEEVKRAIPDDKKSRDQISDLPLTALVVDDEVDMVHSITSILTNLPGVKVQPAYTLKEAEYKTEVLARNPAEPVVIFLDIRLPDGNGLDFLAKVKKNNPQMEVIIVTAFHDAPTALQAMQRGAAYFIAKPFGMEELLQVAESTITYARARKFLEKICRLEEEMMWPVYHQRLKLKQLYKERLFSNQPLTAEDAASL